MSAQREDAGGRPACRHLALFLSGLAGGGAQRRMLILARAFAERGHRVDLVVVRPEGPFRSEVSSLVRLVVLDPRWGHVPLLATRKGLWVLAAVPALAGYLQRVRPDVLLSTSNPANVAALWARRLARVPVPVVISVNVHLSAATGPGQRFWRPLLRGLARRSYPAADAAIAISRGVAVDLALAGAIPEARIATIHNPVDVGEIERRARAPLQHPWFGTGRPPVVLAVGKLKIQKDYATLLRAFARVRAARQVHLVILGEGEERHRLEQLARRLGVTADVALPGFVDNPFAWMACASVFVLSSAWEGFSNALVEALACGCPVVSTNCPSGPAEILDHGAYGPLVPVGDDGALAAAVLSVLQRPISPDRLRARAAVFSVDAAADRYLEILLAAWRDSCRCGSTGRGPSGERGRSADPD
ncbi:MAG: glycosyltransferase [Candidatus Binatia bacterium]